MTAQAAHPNVLAAIAEMEGYIARINAGATDDERRAFRREAVACGDLMNYSHEIADTDHPTWSQLTGLVTEVHVLTNDLARA